MFRGVWDVIMTLLELSIFDPVAIAHPRLGEISNHANTTTTQDKVVTSLSLDET